MKKVFLAAAVLLSTIAMAQDQKPDDVIRVNAEKHEFGKIKQGVPVTTFFEITNKSDKPIVIENATAGCGCTTPEYPKAPIAPNGTAKLKVGYNAAAMGPFTKEVYVKLAGVKDQKIVRISGEVLDNAAWETYVKSAEYKKAQQGKTSDAKKAKTSKASK